MIWPEGGKAYVYVIYEMWNQYAAVVNAEDVPDVVFVRAVSPQFLEDHGAAVAPDRIRTGKRIGISGSREGHDAPLRHFVKPADLPMPQ